MALWSKVRLKCAPPIRRTTNPKKLKLKRPRPLRRKRRRPWPPRLALAARLVCQLSKKARLRACLLHWSGRARTPVAPLMSLFFLQVFFLQVQRRGVHAVAHTGWLGAVFEEMSEVGIAFGAPHFGSHHPMSCVAVFDDRILPEGLKKAGPAGGGVIFCFRSGQGLRA